MANCGDKCPCCSWWYRWGRRLEGLYTNGVVVAGQRDEARKRHFDFLLLKGAAIVRACVASRHLLFIPLLLFYSPSKVRLISPSQRGLLIIQATRVWRAPGMSLTRRKTSQIATRKRHIFFIFDRSTPHFLQPHTTQQSGTLCPKHNHRGLFFTT